MNHAELASCAVVNFENFEHEVPNIKKHPMYQIAMMQLRELEAALMNEMMGKVPL